ncbi:MAG TPA: ATP-binding protein [Bacteroidales bacterium]|nr:ATP-binding protein [Bacteroidales bacterium]
MVSEKFLQKRSRLIILLLCIISFIAAGFFFGHSDYVFASILLLAGLISASLLHKIYDSSNEVISFFFDSLRNDDTALQFPVKNVNSSLKKLYHSMNLLNDHFKEIRLRNEYNETYYKTIIQNASAGLVVINNYNVIELINKVACNYAGISSDSKNPDLLKIKHPDFYKAVCNLKPGEHITYRNLLSGNLQLLSFRATTIKRNEAELKLVSIQDIRYELESREVESYRKLINVLTHEIMNLLTPLTTVAKELYSMFHNKNEEDSPEINDEKLIKTTMNGLLLIDEQTNGVLNFINNYRKISKLPKPVFAAIDTNEWKEQLMIVFDTKMKENYISFSIVVDKSLKSFTGDKRLINQVIINLINNAFDAVLEIPDGRIIEIHLMKTKYDKIQIKLTNNGPLIPPNLQEKIFVPFFTGKVNGSGIGLSISQEIMKLHNGSIVVVSNEKEMTNFIVEF